MKTQFKTTASAGEPWALRNLPPFPWITTKVLQLYATDGEDVAVGRLTELIRSDASLSSELLRRANSALYGLRQQVDSIERAVTMLGLDQIRALAMTLGIGDYVKAALRLTMLRRCWQHSLGCALLAEELTETTDIRPDQAYTAGLLHDVGRLALLVKYPEPYADLLSVVIENNFNLMQSERDLFDVDHCQAGAWLAGEWNFPKELVEVIGFHHQPPEGNSSELLTLTHLSCRLADSLGFAVTFTEGPEDPLEILKQWPGAAGLEAEDIEVLKESVTTKVTALE